MYQRFWFYILALALTFTSLVHAVDYGVGFSLALDYGTASIHFSNGSAVDVVKIIGCPAYKQAMRNTTAMRTTEVWNNDAPKSQFRFPGSLRSWKSVAQEVQSLPSLLPPWLGGQDCRSQESQSLSWMVNALKTTTEAYLETPISTAEVVFPFPPTDLYYDAARSAFSSLSLRMPMSKQPPAGILAARAYGLGQSCGNPMVAQPLKPGQTVYTTPGQLILTVDYSDAALTALLVFEECSIFEYLRVTHDTNLGASAHFETSDARRDDLVHALRDITTLPLEDGNGEGLNQINEVVLLGERADDHYLHEALREVLQPKYGASTIMNNYKDGYSANVEDPLFAASRGVALDCWDRLNFSSPWPEGIDI